MNPEPMARFIDLFVIGDGEESLPELCDLWLELKQAGIDRETMLAEMAARLPYVYVPRFYEPQDDGDGRPRRFARSAATCPTRIEPAVVADLESFPPPGPRSCLTSSACRTGSPSRSCAAVRASAASARARRSSGRLRFRKVETIVQAALEQYRNTGYNEISLLSLSTSDYPQFDELMRRLQETFRPLGVSVSLPSLRINEQLRFVGELMNTDRHSGLTLAPEVARDDMRRQIGKPITNDDLYAGCRRAFENGFSRVKLYFMCGLPGERETDLDGIIEMSETISRLGQEVTRPAGRRWWPTCRTSCPSRRRPTSGTPCSGASISRWAHEFLHRRKRLRSVQLKCHDIEASLLEGVMCRGDRRVGEAIELAWRRGAGSTAGRRSCSRSSGGKRLADAGIDVEKTLHLPCPAPAALPWDHIGIRQGRGYLEREQRWRRNRWRWIAVVDRV